MDISLYGDSLKKWNVWLINLKKKEWLLSWAININKIGVKVSAPIWMIARLIEVPIMFIDLITFRLLLSPFRFIVKLILSLLMISCNYWERGYYLRPILIVSGPLIVIITMVLVSLIPYESDIRDTQYLLCELWPLSQRRLNWINEYGNGKDHKD